jgi:hypothetical protein
MEALVNIQVVIIMMSIKREIAMEIDWKALDRCWVERYDEEYGHYFSDRSYIETAIHYPVIAAIEATIY